MKKTVVEVKLAKQILENQIAECVRKYQQDTQTKVTFIHIDTCSDKAMAAQNGFEIKITAEL